MEIDSVDKLIFRVIEQVAADNCELDKVIEFIVSFSYEQSLSAEILLKLSLIFDKYEISTSPTGSENHLSPLRFQTFNRKVF